jgi:zinc protease
VLRAKAAQELAYGSLNTSPTGVLQRDLEYLLRGGDPRFATPSPEVLKQVTPEGSKTRGNPSWRPARWRC